MFPLQSSIVQQQQLTQVSERDFIWQARRVLWKSFIITQTRPTRDFSKMLKNILGLSWLLSHSLCSLKDDRISTFQAQQISFNR